MELTESHRDLLQIQYEKSIARVAEVITDWMQPSRGGVFEDWGCGWADEKGPWAKKFVTRMQYVGVDVVYSPGVDVVQNVVYRRSNPDSILIHHVLGVIGEYWEMVVSNAMASFGHRMVIVESASNIPPARMLQVLQSFARPFTVEVLPDGRRMYLIER